MLRFHCLCLATLGPRRRWRSRSLPALSLTRNYRMTVGPCTFSAAWMSRGRHGERTNEFVNGPCGSPCGPPCGRGYTVPLHTLVRRSRPRFSSDSRLFGVQTTTSSTRLHTKKGPEPFTNEPDNRSHALLCKRPFQAFSTQH